MTLDEARNSVGRRVLYYSKGDDTSADVGTIKSVNDSYVFVTFGGMTMACYARDLVSER